MSPEKLTIGLTRSSSDAPVTIWSWGQDLVRFLEGTTRIKKEPKPCNTAGH
jgi:hypothetical protein